MTLNQFIKKYRTELIFGFLSVVVIFSIFGITKFVNEGDSIFAVVFAGVDDDGNLTNPGNIIGYHDDNFNNTCSVTGWTAFSLDKYRDPNFKIYANKVATGKVRSVSPSYPTGGTEFLVAEGIANKPRTDLLDAGVCANGTCAFNENLTDKLESGITYNIRVVGVDALGNEINLQSTNKEITCGEPIVLPPTCTNPDPVRDLSFTNISVSGNQATAEMINNSSSCSYNVGLASYKTNTPPEPDFQSFVNSQILHDSDMKVVAPNTTSNFRVDIPSCSYWQVDFFAAPNGAGAPVPPDFLRLLNYHNFDAKVGDSFQNCPVNLNVTCMASPLTVRLGESVTFTADPTGGNGFYTYSWSGDVSGTNRTTTRTFTSIGTKTAIVTVTSGGESATATCQTNVVNIPPPDLNVSCSVSSSSVEIGESVSFTANATGGNGTYSYSWSGDASGNNRTVTRQFSSAGTKTAAVTVTSNGQTDTASCNTVVRPIVTNPIEGSCISTPSVVNIGDNVNWSANASGGAGSYTYDWSGAVSGSGQNRNTTYSTSGTKNATVVIASGGEFITRNCSVLVREPQTAQLSGYCSASSSSVRPNETINWTAYPSGGNGTYSYSWSGDVSGSGSSVSRAYSQTGSKYATVTITSGGQSINTNCQAQVYELSLNVSCGVNSSTYQIGNNVNWYSNVSGGSGSYSYSWSGTDGLGGNSSTINRSYSSVGTKSATVYVTSGNQSAQATCQTNIGNATINEQSLNISCSANPNFAQINQNISWTANIYGGSGSYSYYWSGADGLSGNSSSINRSYSSVGTKNATVTVISGNQTSSATCNVIVSSPIVYSTPVSLTSYKIPGPESLSSVYLSQIPYTGLVSNMSKATAMFLLAFWSAGLAFVALQFAKRKRVLAMAGIDTKNQETPWSVMKSAFMPGSIESPYHKDTEDVDEATSEEEEEEEESIDDVDLEALSKLAISRKALVSKQALQKIYNREDANFESASMELLKIIDQSTLVYPREDGWVVLNSERLRSVENS